MARDRSSTARYVIGGGCLVGILALAFGDLVIDGAGAYWADHAMLGAAIGGLLFVGLTALVIDAVVERSTTRRLRRAAERQVAKLVATPQDPLVQALEAQLAEPNGADWMTVMRRAADRVDRDIARAFSVMMLVAANENFFRLFEAAQRYSDTALNLVRDCRKQDAVFDDAAREVVCESLASYTRAADELRRQAVNAELRLPLSRSPSGRGAH